MKDSLDMRYAIALFALAKEDKKVSFYQRESKTMKKVLSTNPELTHLLGSEFVEINKRYDVVDKVFKKTSPIMRNFLKVLMQNHRLNSYEVIFNSFSRLCNEENHVLEGIVYSTEALKENDIKEIEKALARKSKLAVELTNRIDPSLIGGIKVIINNHIYDYSIANELTTMRNRLKV